MCDSKPTIQVIVFTLFHFIFSSSLLLCLIYYLYFTLLAKVYYIEHPYILLISLCNDSNSKYVYLINNRRGVSIGQKDLILEYARIQKCTITYVWSILANNFIYPNRLRIN